jgi:hypothetical protein
MNKTPPDLCRIQNWMLTVISHPDGIEQGIASSEARRHIDVDSERVDDVISPSRALTSVERLRVYANAYYARLLECLQSEFPALARFLGEETFSGFVFGYLQAYPPSSYTLGDLGTSFPRYLQETSPRAEDAGSNAPWTDFVVDLATLERTYSEVFDGPGMEGTKLLTQQELAAIRMEKWPDTKLIPVPCLRLLSLRFPVHEYASAVRQKREPVVPEPRVTHLAVTRRNFVVRRLELARDEYQLLRALIEHKTVGSAIARTVNTRNADDESFAGRLQEWFRRWAVEGLFRGVECGP